MNTQAQLAQQIEAQTAAHRQSLQHFITGCESRIIGATPVDNSQYAYEQAKNEACGDHDQLTDWLSGMSLEQTAAGKQVRVPGWSTMLEDLSVPDLLVALMQCDDKALPAIRMTLRDKYAAEHAQQIVSRANEIESDMAQEDFE